MSEAFMDMAWSLNLQGARFDNAYPANSQRAQHHGRTITRGFGPSWPMALRPGDTPIKPLILTTPGEWVERDVGALIAFKA